MSFGAGPGDAVLRRNEGEMKAKGMISASRRIAAAGFDRAARRARSISRRVMPPGAEPEIEELRERWTRWLRRAYDDVVVLHDHQSSWDELVDAVEGNAGIPSPNHVMDFIRELYGIVIAVGIRRQADKGDDVANLRRLIDDIARHPEAVTRDWFVTKYPSFLIDVGHQTFDDFAGPGKPHVSPEVIRKDLATLGSVAAKVTRYVNKHLAHAADDSTGTIPTYQDLRTGLTTLDQLLKRYYLLVDGGGLMSSTPTKQFNFLLPLIVPWAPNDRMLRHLRTEEPRIGGTDLEASVRAALVAGGTPPVAMIDGLLAVIDRLRAELAAND